MYASFFISQNTAGSTDVFGTRRSGSETGFQVQQADSGRDSGFFSGFLSSALNPSEDNPVVSADNDPDSEQALETISALLEKLEQFLDEDGVSPELLADLGISEDSPEAAALEELLIGFQQGLLQMEAQVAEGNFSLSSEESLQALEAWMADLENKAGYAGGVSSAGQGNLQGGNGTKEEASSADFQSGESIKTDGSNGEKLVSKEDRSGDNQKGERIAAALFGENAGKGQGETDTEQKPEEIREDGWESLFKNATGESGQTNGSSLEKLLVKGLDLMTSTFESQSAQPDKKAGDGMLKAEMDGPSLLDKKSEAAHKSEDRENQIRLDAEVKTGEQSKGAEEKTISQNPELKGGSAEKESAVLSLSGEQKTSDAIQQDMGKEAVSSNQTISRADSQTQVKASEGTAQASQVQPGVLDQIVEKATLMLKDGKHEMVVELRPEVMGRLKMELSLEHHHLNVKMMAESPAVRDLIQQNLPQLRTELQNQGLDVDRMDVHTQNEKDLSAGNREMNGSNEDSSRTPMGSSNDPEAQTANTEESGSLKDSDIQNSNGRISYFA